MTPKLRDAFLGQANSCAALGSPFMARLMTLCAERLDSQSALGQQLCDWPGDVSSKGHSLPLRLAGGLHALVLNGHALAAHYPPNQTSDDALWGAVAHAIETEGTALAPWIASPPQTNEVRRSAALIVAASLLSARHGLPLALSELGASAGLNLHFDLYGCGALGAQNSPVQLVPEITGPAPAPHPIRVHSRAGVDLTPLDPSDQIRLLSYLWPDQPERLRLTRAALSLNPPRPEAGDAAPWLAERLDHTHEGALHLVYHTVAFQYFPPDTQAACLQALEEAGARATKTAPLAHLSFEADDTSPGAALTLTTWPGGQIEPLGRVDFHGRWLRLSEREDQ